MAPNLTPTLCQFRQRAGLLLSVLLPAAMFAAAAAAQPAQSPAQPLITQPVNESNMVVLRGNTRPEANAANDRGLVADSMPMTNLMLQLRRPVAQEQALVALIDQLHNPNSPNFHHWLSAAQVGAQFGPADADIQIITGWLTQHGFTVNTLYANRMVVDFSGTAGQIRNAFHTEIHSLSVNGEAHIANMTDPQIPAALAPAIVGIVSLHDFRPNTGAVQNPQFKGGSTEFTRNGNYFVTPPDLQTIYNINPVFSGGTTGAGQTIYLLEDSDLYGGTGGGINSDWSTFRAGFGIPLSSYPTASVNTVHPGCADPGVNSDDGEAILDAEYSSASAPGAAIVMATCSNILTAIQTLVNSANPPAIMNLSYGVCEVNNGAASNAAFNTAFQTGAAGGMSIYGISHDRMAGMCDRAEVVFNGIGVNAWASTQYNVAVGGTDFGDTYLGVNSTYWNSTNSAARGSAKSYMPEIPWNSSCASQLYASFNGYSATYGPSGFCNSNFAGADGEFLTDWGGGGGPSACATGSATVSGVVSGSCSGYPKPSWQTGVVGIPNDGVRDLPDISLFASFDPWLHSYVICYSDTANGGTTCNGTDNGWSYGWGGTSFAAPIMSGVQALINQHTGTKWGNPNYRFYQMAANEYGATGSTDCNSTKGNAVSGSCIFYDVTMGDNDAPCRADSGTLYNCYRPSGTYGVLSTSNSSYQPAFPTKVGWDFATGIGTVNVANLVNNWVSSKLTATHDFNGDGKSDALWRNVDGDVGIWLMNGSQITQGVTIQNVPNFWSVVGQRDFTGNGDADILWQDNSGNVGMWLMNGTTLVQGGAIGSAPTSWSIVGTGDFNGDGKADILWRDTSGNIGIWFMNGTTTLQTITLGNLSTDWAVMGADMKGDIFWRNTITGEFGMWVMNGATVAQSVSFGLQPLNWTVAGIGDFDGNGSEDILWRDTSGDVATWLMNGTQFMSSTTFANVPTNWNIVQTGDYNGDGKSDILWFDNSGNVGVWFMNGTTILQGYVFGNVGTNWGVQSLGAD